MIEQTYKLNMIPRAEQDFRSYEPPVVHISQYDKVLRTLRFELYDGEDPFTIPENTAAYIYGMKPDGNAFQYQMDITEDGLLQIDVQTQMATVAGCVTCEVILFEGNESGNRIGSANFKMAVEKAAVGDDAQFSESDMPVIQTLLFGGTPGDILVKDEDGVKWNSESLSVGYMRYDQYDPDRTGTVNSARQANNAATVDGHTVARNVLADEYTNSQIDDMIEQAGQVKTVNEIQPDQNGNVQIAKADIGLGNVDNTSDANKPISSAAQEALDQKVDKVPGMGLSQNSFTDTEKEKLGALPTSAELTAELSEKVDKEAGKGLSTNDYTTAEKDKLQGIETGAQVNTVLGVKGGDESVYRTGNVNITKENIGLGNVDNTSDMDKPISTATQTALDLKQNTLTFDTTPTAGSTNPVTSDGIAAEISALNSNLSQKVSSVNSETPDTIGNVSLNAEDIPADGVGSKDVSGNPIIVTDAVAENAQNLSVDLEPIQDLHGYDHPWAGGAGKNKFSGGTIVTVDNALFTNVEVAPIPAGTYTISAIIGSEPTGYSGCRIAFRKVDGSSLEAVNLPYTANKRTSVTFTLPETCGRIYFYYSATTAGTGNQTYTNVQIEEGSTATAWEPYSNICPITGRTQVEITNKDSEDVEQASVTVDLLQTVYGGTLNVTTGELTVETANIASYNGESIGEPWWSSMDEYVSGTTPTTGAQVVYTLATPTTVSLTPAQIALLEGYNILNTDGDALNLRYTGTVASNVQSEIDEFEESTRTLAGSIAMNETSPATANHAVGDYLMLNNRFCKVTAAIATGEQIIIGSNVQYTTIAEELTAILAQINA